MNNILADDDSNASAGSYWTLHKWTFSDFTPWAFVSAFLSVPGGTAGVYAVRQAGLAVSVGICSCVIVILSYIWGVLLFGEEQKSTWGAMWSVAVQCVGLCGSVYFSSREVDLKANVDATQKTEQMMKQGISAPGETTPLVRIMVNADELISGAERFPHLGLQQPHPQNTDIHQPSLSTKYNNHTYRISRYHTGLCMAVVNGILVATIMVPLHYIPSETTYGLGYSMSFGIATVLVTLLFWIMRFIWLVSGNCIHSCLKNSDNEHRQQIMSCGKFLRIAKESLQQGHQQLPSFHLQVMWKAGMTSGVLYSVGNLFGIVSIQKLGDFMGYSFNQSSVIVSGEPPGTRCV